MLLTHCSSPIIFVSGGRVSVRGNASWREEARVEELDALTSRGH
jgi:hypothetical protein